MPINLGVRPTGIVTAPHLVISGLEAMAEQFEIDPNLPVLGQDPFLPNSDFIVAPRGRLAGVKNPATASLPAYAQEGRSLVTLANGSEGLTLGGVPTDVKPLGFFETPQLRVMSEQVQPKPQVTRGKLLSLPYVQMSNGAYGALKPGDRVTAYYGTASSGAPLAQEVGKVVKWVPRGVYSVHQAAGTTVTLSQAIYPAFRPTVLMASNAGAFVAIANVSYAYVGNSWQATLSAAATDVLYSWGQDADNIAGQVVGFTAVGNAGGALDHLHTPEGWLNWVRDDFDAWTLPPLDLPRPFQTIIGEAPQSIGGGQYRLSAVPLVPSKTISVNVVGSRTDPLTGVTTALDGSSPLPLAQNTFLSDYTYGADYTIDPVTGLLTIFSNVSVTSLAVSYSAGTRYIDGRLYDPGVVGLTDGRFSGVRGTPTNLELFGCIAEMRVAIF